MPYNTEANAGMGNYVQQTPLFEIARLQQVDIKSEEFKQLLVQLYQQVNNIALELNSKDTGYYINQEVNISSILYNLTSSNPQNQRPIYRKTFFTGVINAGVNNIPHGLTITATWDFVKILGAAKNTAGGIYIPLPYVSVAATPVQVSVNNVNIVINNASGVVYDSGYITLEFVKF